VLAPSVKRELSDRSIRRSARSKSLYLRPPKADGSEIVMLGAFWPYLRFVCSTSTWAQAPADYLGTVKRNQPVIIALWHGQTMLLPEVLLFEISPSCAIVANSLVAEPLARTLQRMGIGVIRGAGRSWRGKDRHGARALRAAIKSLAGGVSVAMTADQLTCSRRCGLGIVTLARLSGRPIVPMAIASSRYCSLHTPNRYTINFPYSRLALVVGKPMFISRDDETEAIEQFRQGVENALNEVTHNAYAAANGSPPRDCPDYAFPQEVVAGLRDCRTTKERGRGST
jgi:3-deoxy-D-manno-octulosonic-acid transferase